MRSNDAQDLSSDFEPGPLAIGPDGVEMTPQAKVIPLPPRICEQGPCVHYHCVVVQLDAEAPLGQGLEPGGRIDGLPEAQPFYRSRKHYCYPDVGIEIELGATPVLECNRWTPKIASERTEIDTRREAFMTSPAGQAYARELAEWHAARAEEIDPSDPVRSWIELNMRDGDEAQLYRLTPREGHLAPEYDALRIPLLVADRGAAETWCISNIREEFGSGTYAIDIGRLVPGHVFSEIERRTLSIEVI